MALLFKTSGKVEGQTPWRTVAKKDTKFTLEELRNVVGGDIEIIRLTPHLLMVVNETGKVQKDPLPMNYVATVFYQVFRGSGDVIVGDVLLCAYPGEVN